MGKLIEAGWRIYASVKLPSLVADRATSHYLNWCWNIVHLTLRNTLQWNIKQNSYIFLQDNAFENVVCEMLAFLSWPQCVKGQTCFVFCDSPKWPVFYLFHYKVLHWPTRFMLYGSTVHALWYIRDIISSGHVTHWVDCVYIMNIVSTVWLTHWDLNKRAFWDYVIAEKQNIIRKTKDTWINIG